MYKICIKRLLDVVISFSFLILLLPVFLIVTIFLEIGNKGAGAFFSQKRAGKNGKVFKVIKFKSMSDEKNEYGSLLSDEKRLTPLGKILRATSIDELPQLFNVLKGDMSLVGPRPLLPEYTPLYNEMQMKRLSVKPGITGLAQVHGRNALKLSKRFEYDVYYVEHVSFMMDMKVVWLTFKSLLPHSVVVDRGQLVGVDDLGFDEKAFNEKHK